MPSRATRRQVASLAALGVVVAVGLVVFSPAALARWLAGLSARPLLFVGVLAVLYVVRPFLLWPIFLLSMVVGYVFGFPYGVPVALAGTVGTCVVPFAVARYARTDRGVVGFASRSSERYVTTTGHLRGVVAARLSPVPADAVSWGAGLSEVSLGTYVLGTAIGEIPWVVAEVLAGSSMRTLSVEGMGHSLSLVVGTTALATVMLAGPVYRHLRDRETGTVLSG